MGTRRRIRIRTDDVVAPPPHPKKRKSSLSIIDALNDPNLLGAALGSESSWATWKGILRSAFGQSLTSDELSVFHSVAGERAPPTKRVSEFWAVAGRRSGKTRVASALSVFIATCERHRLAPGETGYVLLLAASKAQAGAAFNYVLGFLQSSPVLWQQVETTTADEIRLKGNIVIGVHSNSYRTIRSRTLLCVIGDETSFWKDDTSAAPDVETYRACIPSLAATGGMFVGISTGYRKTGLLYQKWRDHYGRDSDDVLVVQGSTELFNPSLSTAIIRKAKAADPEAAESEWDGGFRSDFSAFLDEATIEASIDHDRPLELPPNSKHHTVAFCDASGGRHDAFTLCLGHREGETYVCDVIRGVRPPFNPADVVKQYARLLREYGIRSIRGDNYSAEWVQSAWRAEGISYERSPLPASALYLESLPLFVRGLVRIPNHAQLVRELRLLERQTSRGGKDRVSHGRTGMDDHANSVSGMLQMLTKTSKYKYRSNLDWVGDFSPQDERMLRLRAYMLTGGLL